MKKDFKKRFLIYGINYFPELTGIGKYTAELSKELSKISIVDVVTAQPYYPEWKIKDGYKNFYSIEEDENIKISRCPLYVPKKPNAFKRILHLLSFSFASLPTLFLSFLKKPNFVIYVVPTLFSALQVIIFSKLFRVKSIVHVQDYEFDAFFLISKNLHSVLKSIGEKIERLIYNSFDYVSTISDGMVSVAISKGVDPKKIILMPNWADVQLKTSEDQNFNIHSHFKIHPSNKIILYSGNIGEKQGLEIILDAANALKEEQFIFLIAGEGATKEKLIEKRDRLQLKNVIFSGLFEKEIFFSVLRSAHAHLVLQKKGVGDIVLPSKLTNILAVGGNAIISAEKGSFLYELCYSYDGLANIIEPEDINELINALKNTQEKKSYNLAARNYAENYLDKKNIIKQFLSDIEAYEP